MSFKDSFKFFMKVVLLLAVAVAVASCFTFFVVGLTNPEFLRNSTSTTSTTNWTATVSPVACQSQIDELTLKVTVTVILLVILVFACDMALSHRIRKLEMGYK